MSEFEDPHIPTYIRNRQWMQSNTTLTHLHKQCTVLLQPDPLPIGQCQQLVVIHDRVHVLYPHLHQTKCTCAHSCLLACWPHERCLREDHQSSLMWWGLALHTALPLWSPLGSMWTALLPDQACMEKVWGVGRIHTVDREIFTAKIIHVLNFRVKYFIM